MQNIILHAHFGLRYLVLLLIVAAIIQGFSNKKVTDFTNNKLPLSALIVTHIQLLLGLFLYFTSDKVQFIEGFMKDATLRFFGMEHILGMVIAVALITIGYSRAKKVGFKAISLYYLFGLIIMLLTIPWPGRVPGGTWF